MNYLEKHKNEIFKKYSNEELLRDIDSFKNGKGKLTKVLNQFFEECMFECCGKKTKISPMQCLESDELMEKILAYIASKPKFFTGNEIQNVKSCFRNSMSWVRKVANFPVRTAKDIYERYDLGGQLNCLDTSAGFGSRMSAVLLSGHNYCGFDPNKKLMSQLKNYYQWLKDNNQLVSNQRCGLYCQGSEVFIPSLVNTFDVSFTSPPYFNLEKYSDDNSASTYNYNNYYNWVVQFVEPTVMNTYSYLRVGGYAMINIKNLSKKEPCFDDFFRAFSMVAGFEYVETFDMTIPKKQYGMAHNNEKGEIVNKEPIMVFKKVK